MARAPGSGRQLQPDLRPIEPAPTGEAGFIGTVALDDTFCLATVDTAHGAFPAALPLSVDWHPGMVALNHDRPVEARRTRFPREAAPVSESWSIDGWRKRLGRAVFAEVMEQAGLAHDASSARRQWARLPADVHTGWHRWLGSRTGMAELEDRVRAFLDAGGAMAWVAVTERPASARALGPAFDDVDDLEILCLGGAWAVFGGPYADHHDLLAISDPAAAGWVAARPPHQHLERHLAGDRYARFLRRTVGPRLLGLGPTRQPARARRAITQLVEEFLAGEWVDQRLIGRTRDEAYRVNAGPDLCSDGDILAGHLGVEIDLHLESGPVQVVIRA